MAVTEEMRRAVYEEDCRAVPAGTDRAQPAEPAEAVTHRSPAPRPALPAPDPLVRATGRLALMLAGGNVDVGVALLTADPGTC